MTLKLVPLREPSAHAPGSGVQVPAAAQPSWTAGPAAGSPLLAGILAFGAQGSASFPLAGPPGPRPPAAAALKAFRRLARLWDLGMADQLTLLGLRETQKATYYRWVKEAQAGAPTLQLDRDPLDRIGHLLAIFEALGHLFQVPEQADAWVRRPNPHPLFQDRPPLARLLRGGMEDLIAVRAYVEGAREGQA
ncbi:MAG: antitoxin Xre-like helix-turn-helix domain-containing protein [Holophaga sp.]|jgi:hypothetical protein